MNAIETDGRRLYAATWEGVYISLDYGDTWRSTEPQHGVSAIAISRDVVYAATFLRGVFAPTVPGETWNPKNNASACGSATTERVDTQSFRIYSSPAPARSSQWVHRRHVYIQQPRRDMAQRRRRMDTARKRRPRGFPPVYIAHRVRSMTEFDGYLWVAYSSSQAFRSPDNGEMWEGLPYWADGGSIADFGTIVDWAVLDDRLYVVGHEGIGRWNETELHMGGSQPRTPAERHNKPGC